MPLVPDDWSALCLREPIPRCGHASCGQVMCDAAQRLATQHTLDNLVDDDDLLGVGDESPVAVVVALGQVTEGRYTPSIFSGLDVVLRSRRVALADRGEFKL